MSLRSRFDGILKEIEAQPYYDIYLPTKALIELRNEAEASQDTHIAELAQWEIYACTVYPQDITRRVKNEYRTVEAVDTWKQEQFLYYFQRFHECTQIQLKCNYGEVILDCRGQGRLTNKKKFEVFNALVPLLIQRGRLDLENYEKGFRFHSIAGAFEWSLRFGNVEYITMCINELIELLIRVGPQYSFMEIPEAVDILFSVLESSKFKYLLQLHNHTIIKEMVKAKEVFEANRDFLSLDDILDRIIKWYKALGYSKDQVHGVITEKGKALIRRAELEESYIVKGMLYDDAVKLFISIGETSTLNELQTKKREYLRKAERDEMKHMSVPIPFPETVKEYLAIYEAIPDSKAILERMMIDPNLVPDDDQDSRISPLSLIMSRIVLHDGRVVGRASSTEENIDTQKSQLYLLELQFIANCLTGHILNVALGKGLTSNDILAIYSSWEFYNKNREPILMNGFDKFVKRDYIAAVHILAPQFEACIREMFEAVGIRGVVHGDGTDKEQVLNKFLERPEIRKVLGEQFTKYLEMVLVAPEGWNIRNDISHGILAPSAFTHESASVILHLYLRLLAFRRLSGNTKKCKEENNS